MAPVIDGSGGFLPDHPEALREAGSVAEVSIISGILQDDGSYYTVGCKLSSSVLSFSLLSISVRILGRASMDISFPPTANQRRSKLGQSYFRFEADDEKKFY